MFGKRKSPSRSSEPHAPQIAGATDLAGGTAGGDCQPRSPLGAPLPAAKPGQPAAGAAAAPAAKSPPRRTEGRLPSAVEGRKLVVGREICLSGEIKTCEKLVVEGKVEADLRDSHSLEISEPGLFKGNATVEDCEVSGIFEGELIVTGLLVVTPTGRVSGKIRYAEMELARGATLSGDIDRLDEAGLRRARGDGPKLAHDSRGTSAAGEEAGGKSQIG